MNYNVLLGYVKQAWKNYLREGNVSFTAMGLRRH